MFFFSQDYHIGDVCFPHQYPKKRKGDEFQLNRLLILDSLVSCFTVLFFSKERQKSFLDLSISLTNTPMGNTVTNVCNTMFEVTVTDGS